MAKKFLKQMQEDNPVLTYLSESALAQAELDKIKKIRAKDVLVSDLKQIPELRDLFPRNLDIYQRLKDDIEKDGLLSPIIVWKSERIVVDGNTRFEIVKELGWDKIEVKELDFENLEEAKKLAEILQFDRRNFSQAEIFEYANKDIEHTFGTGRDVEIKASKLNVSPSTIKRAKYVDKYGTEEQKESINNGESTITSIYTDIKKNQFINENATEEQKESINNGEIEIDEIYKSLKSKKHKSNMDDDDVLEDEKNPRATYVHTRKEDDSPKFTAPEETELDAWTIEKNKQIENASKENYAKGFETATYFILSEVIKGRSPKEIIHDERLEDFSPTKIWNFPLPDDAEEMVDEL